MGDSRAQLNSWTSHRHHNWQQRNIELFRYLALPIELRLRIAEYYLLDGPFTPDYPHQVNIANDEPKFIKTALLRICRTVYAELRVHYHARLTLAFGARHLRGDEHVLQIGGMLCKIGQIRHTITTFQVTLYVRSYAPAEAEDYTMADIAYTMSRHLPNLKTIRLASRMQVYPEDESDDMSRF